MKNLNLVCKTSMRYSMDSRSMGPLEKKEYRRIFSGSSKHISILLDETTTYIHIALDQFCLGVEQ